LGALRQKVPMKEAAPSDFEPARFAKGFLDRSGPYFLRRDPDCIVVGLRIEDGHLNYVGVAHGGVLTSLADVALSLQVHALEVPSLSPVTNSLTTNFIGAARLGDWLEAHTRIDQIGKRLAHTSGQIRRGEDLIMTMTGVFSIRRPA
jgi:acyl-coenzyme A thioesterase 13